MIKQQNFQNLLKLYIYKDKNKNIKYIIKTHYKKVLNIIKKTKTIEKIPEIKVNWKWNINICWFSFIILKLYIANSSYNC